MGKGNQKGAEWGGSWKGRRKNTLFCEIKVNGEYRGRFGFESLQVERTERI